MFCFSQSIGLITDGSQLNKGPCRVLLWQFRIVKVQQELPSSSQGNRYFGLGAWLHFYSPQNGQRMLDALYQGILDKPQATYCISTHGVVTRIIK